MTAATRPCTYRGCGNTTTDPTGRCHHHRGPFTWGGKLRPPSRPIPSPSMPSDGWEPGRIHPTGGYDDVTQQSFGYGREFQAETKYYLDGRVHRLDGPAIVYSDGKTITREQWWIGEVRHRSDGPADVTYEYGAISKESYFADGKYHRLDGPAQVSYDSDGTAYSSLFYVRGLYVTSEKHARIREAIESGAPEEWAMAYAEGAED